jgi:hypothetical protein
LSQKQEKTESEPAIDYWKNQAADLATTLKARDAKIVYLTKKLSKKGLKETETTPPTAGETPEQAAEVSESPKQPSETHFAHEWEPICTTCGGKNEKFAGPPNVFCYGPNCKGKIPVGHVDIEAVKKRVDPKTGEVDLPELGHACLNCGSEEFLKVEAI